MQQDKYHMLHQIFSRLCFHYGLDVDSALPVREHFIASLQHYPEDLLCAAYHHELRHTEGVSFPAPESFIEFMQPEFFRRAQTQCVEECYG